MESKAQKINKTYKTLFWIFGIMTLIMFFLLLIVEIGSIGHDFYPWGIRVSFNQSEVTIEPDIPCLFFNNYWSQGAYNLVIAKGDCTGDLQVNGARLNLYHFYWIYYENNTASVEINNFTIIANQDNNYTFIFPIEYNGETSTVKIPVFVEN